MIWVLIWTALICAMVALEFWTQSDLVKGNTMTSYMRHHFLRSVFGSMVIGALLVWLIWHWLFVSSGSGWEDALAMVVGLLLGFVGHLLRRRETFT